MQKRLEWLDQWKGFAIILVVIGHVIDGATMYKDVAWMQYVFKAIYTFHMPLFFFLSGIAYGLSKKKNSRRILNLILLYIIWSCIGYFFKNSFSGVVTNTISENVLVCLLIKPVDPYWYLIVLAIYYLIADLMNRRRIEIVIPYLFFISVIAFEVYHRIDFADYLVARYIYRIFYHTLFFYCGMKWESIKEYCIGKDYYAGMTFVVALVLYFIGISEMAIICAVSVIIGTVALVVKVGGVFHRSKKQRLLQALQFLGKNSLCIYLMHNYFTVLYRMVWNKIASIRLPASSILYVVPNTIIAVVGCLIGLWIVKKVPVFQFFLEPMKVLDSVGNKNKR